jgi:tetrahydromethanopterin S-methyltransferase subunit C
LQAKGVKMKPRREVGLTVMAIVGLPIAIMGFFTLDEHPSPGVKIANSVLALLLLLAALADTLQHGSNVLLWGLQVFYSLWVLGYFSVSLIKKSFK